jgi:translation initiation factor 3 subunit M
VKPLAELLRIICDGALTDFLAFQGAAANKAALTQHKLDAASLEHNVKLLALCALAAQATDKSLTFGAIQTALQVQAEEVELWVIEAIGEKLLEASIDQITGTVTVK